MQKYFNSIFLYFCFVISKNSCIFALENDIVLTFKNRLDYGYYNCSEQNRTSVVVGR